MVWTYLWVDFDGSNVRFFVNVFDAGFIYITIMHLDLKERKEELPFKNITDQDKS